jgi:hypothetical protein
LPRCGEFLTGEIVGRAVITDQIGIDAVGAQRVGIALIGARLELDTACAVQNDDAGALRSALCRIACQGDITFAGRNAQAFRPFRTQRTGGRKKRKPAQDASAADHSPHPVFR